MRTGQVYATPAQRWAAAEMERAHRHAEARREHEEQLRQAEADVVETKRAASDARAKARFAAAAVNEYPRKFALRADAVHRGVATVTARANDVLHQRLVDVRLRLAQPDPQVGLPELGALVSLFVATQPEFAAKLHELLDADVPAPHPPLSRVTDDEYDAELAALKGAAQDAADAATAAEDEWRRAVEDRNAIERGQKPRHREG